MATFTTVGNGGNWATASAWGSAVVPNINDIARVNHVISVTANANVGGIDPTSTGCIVATTTSPRLVVGLAGRPCFVLKPVVL